MRGFPYQGNYVQQPAQYNEFYPPYQSEQSKQNSTIYQQNGLLTYPNSSPKQFSFVQQQPPNVIHPQMNGNYQMSPPMSPLKKNKNQDMRQLYVVVIPMESNQDPYQMELKIKGNETSLKQVFDENINNYWTKVFKGHSPKEPPSYSVFRKAMNNEANYSDEFQGKSNNPSNHIIIGLHILLLKCEGYKFPRNPNAHSFELFCNTHFYGPLVVAMNMNQVPFHLASFKIDFVKDILKINEAEKRQYPPPFVPTNSQKKNKTMPFYVTNEQRGDFSDDLQKLKESMETEMFYIYRYKTAYCPQKNVKHDWSQCFFAHRPQDFRRAPDKFFYLPDDCKNFQEDQEDGGCPLGFKCKYSHSTYERLYHPLKYKTNPCDQSQKSKKKHCKRGSMCAFYHEKLHKRHPQSCQRSQPFYKIAGPHMIQNSGQTQRPHSPPVIHQNLQINPTYVHGGHYSPQMIHNHHQQFQFSPMHNVDLSTLANRSPTHNPMMSQSPQHFSDFSRSERTMSNSFFETRPPAFSLHMGSQGVSNFQEVNIQQPHSPPSKSPSKINFTLHSMSENGFQANLQVALNPESHKSSSGSDTNLNNINNIKGRALSAENAFASPGGLPYLTDYNYEEENEDDMEIHIDEEMQNQILANIYCSKQQQEDTNRKISVLNSEKVDLGSTFGMNIQGREGEQVLEDLMVKN